MPNHSARILYLSYDGLTDPLGQSQIVPYLIGLSAKGYSIYIVSFEKPERFRQLGAAIRNLAEANGISWFPLTYSKNPPVLSTLYDIVRLLFKTRRLHQRFGFAIVHCRSYITSLVGLQLKNDFGLKFIFDMRGFWADERVEGGIWNLRNPLYKLSYSYFKKKEILFLNRSDVVVSLTNNAKKIIEKWKTSAPVVVIPCCIDTILFDPASILQSRRDDLRTKLGIEAGDLVLLYLGSWGTWYQTSDMLDFFSKLKKSNPTAKFLVLSPDKVDTTGYSHAESVIVKSAKREDVPLYISLASVAVIFISPTFSKSASSATKMGELLAMNVPIVTNSGWGDVDEIVKATHGYFIETFVREVPASYLSYPTRGYCMQHMSLELGVDRYSILYSNLLSHDKF